MRPELLINLRDVIADGHDVRRRASAAISSIERTGSATQKQTLTSFFADCSVKSGGNPSLGLPATQSIVSDASTVPVFNSAGANTTVSGTLTVAANVVTKATLPATASIVKNGDIIPVTNSQGSVTQNGTTTTALGVTSKLTLAGTNAIVPSGTAITCTVTGTYVNKITPTVVNGVITAIVLG